MLRNRTFIVIILIGALLLGIVFVIFILRNIISPQQPEDTERLPLPTRVPQQNDQPEGIRYDSKGTDELLRIVTKRPALPQSDQEIRSNLIQSLGNTTGVLYETEEIRIEYVSAPNDFEIEIKTEDIETAKTLGINWLKSQGFSDEGICSLPTFFYLNFEVSQSLRDSGYVFNPIPDFCL